VLSDVKQKQVSLSVSNLQTKWSTPVSFQYVATNPGAKLFLGQGMMNTVKSALVPVRVLCALCILMHRCIFPSVVFGHELTSKPAFVSLALPLSMFRPLMTAP